MLTGLAALATKFWNTAKGKVSAVAALLVTISDALADDNLSREEMAKIVEKAKKIVE